MIALLTVTCWPLIGSAVTNTSSSSSSSWSAWVCLSVFKLLVLTTLALRVLLEPCMAGILEVAWTPCHCHHWEMLSPWNDISCIAKCNPLSCVANEIESKICTWLLRRFLRSEFHCCSLSLKWRNLEASVFSVAFGSPIAMPSSSSLLASSCSW